MATASTQMSTATGGPVSPKKTNWLKIILIAVAALIIFVAGIIALVFSVGSPALKASETFVVQLSSNQVDTAYDSASLQFKQVVTKEQFNAFLEQFPVLKKVQKVSFNSFTIENNFANVSGSITATDGQVSPINLQLVNENDQWRVLNLDLMPKAPEQNAGGNSSFSDLDY